MISEKFSTDPESFNKFGRGRRIDLANSGGMALNQENLTYYEVDICYRKRKEIRERLC